MDEETYRQFLLTTFQDLKHKHPMDDPTYRYEGYNASCGDDITIFLKTEGNKITQINFTGNGCLLSQVSAELLAREIEDKTIDDLCSISLDALLDIVGIHPTPTRMKCIELSLMSAKRAIESG